MSMGQGTMGQGIAGNEIGVANWKLTDVSFRPGSPRGPHFLGDDH